MSCHVHLLPTHPLRAQERREASKQGALGWQVLLRPRTRDDDDTHNLGSEEVPVAVESAGVGVLWWRSREGGEMRSPVSWGCAGVAGA